MNSKATVMLALRDCGGKNITHRAFGNNEITRDRELHA